VATKVDEPQALRTYATSSLRGMRRNAFYLCHETNL